MNKKVGRLYNRHNYVNVHRMIWPLKVMHPMLLSFLPSRCLFFNFERILRAFILTEKRWLVYRTFMSRNDLPNFFFLGNSLLFGLPNSFLLLSSHTHHFHQTHFHSGVHISSKTPAHSSDLSQCQLLQCDKFRQITMWLTHSYST